MAVLKKAETDVLLIEEEADRLYDILENEGHILEEEFKEGADIITKLIIILENPYAREQVLFGIEEIFKKA